MKSRRSFRPTESWNLEDRIALSHASAEVASLATVAFPAAATFHGKYSTTVQHGVDTASATASLSGSSTIPGIGAIRLAGSLANNVVFPGRFGPTQGTFTVTSRTHPGNVVLAFNGPYANLSPTTPETLRLTFTVQSATGPLASYSGTHGTADLSLTPVGKATGGISLRSTSHGNFALVLMVG